MIITSLYNTLVHYSQEIFKRPLAASENIKRYSEVFVDIWDSNLIMTHLIQKGARVQPAIFFTSSWIDV